MRQLQLVLRAALALSWVPLVAIIAVALLRHDTLPAIFVTVALILWLLKLCDMFEVFEP